MQFNDKIVLVTGASRGIGRAIAQQFAARGATVAIHYAHNHTAAQETQTQLSGTGHQLFQADLQAPEQAAQLTTAVAKTYGRIDILVNNAGVFIEHPLAETSYEAWQAAWQTVLNTNLVGVANLMYCVGQVMIEQGHGRVVNISSRGAFRGEPLAPAYGASKAGLNALSQSLAKYLAPYNIFVGVVAPGFVETDMAAEHLSGPSGDEIRNQSPLQRVATPDEVAYAALFLAAEETKFMTGAILDVNGASYLRS
ncbi:MAG: SDR family oxidoreductase [Anaerolineales bacterium]|nr:SDR family oxidoreductase [Anaerolineales bacterium]